MAVRDAGARSPRDDADREVRMLRARWRTASIANGWRFPSDWPLPEVDGMCAALVAGGEGADVAAALALLARARARSGAGLDETLADVAALHAVLSAPDCADGLLAADPDATPSRLVRIAALAWVEESHAELAQAQTTHALTGLTTEAYLRARLAEVYRRAERDGRRPRERHVLMVVTLDLADLVGWPRLVAMVLVADVLREVFNGGESSAVLGPSVAVVLAEREPAFGERARNAAWLIRERLHIDPQLRAANHPEMRCVGLPDTEELAGELLRRLARA